MTTCPFCGQTPLAAHRNVEGMSGHHWHGEGLDAELLCCCGPTTVCPTCDADALRRHAFVLGNFETRRDVEYRERNVATA